MILITGAAGKTGQAVIRALAAQGGPVRAFVHRATQRGTVRALGAQEVVVGDMGVRADLDRAYTGVRAVYHIAPNMSRAEVDLGRLAIQAAQSAGVDHFVYHSVLHPHTEAMPHHWHKLRVEELLFQAGLRFTILQPAAYMQNILAYRSQIQADGLYRVPYAAETRLGMVDLRDVAEAAAIVLTKGGHTGAIYELAGSEILTQTEVAKIIGRQLERSVVVETISHSEWATEARRAGLNEYAIDTLLKMFRYYEAYGFYGNPQILGWLLGRPPTTLEALLSALRGS